MRTPLLPHSTNRYSLLLNIRDGAGIPTGSSATVELLVVGATVLDVFISPEHVKTLTLGDVERLITEAKTLHVASTGKAQEGGSL